MICEPNFNLPQKFNIDALRKSEELENFDANAAIKWSDVVKHKISYVQNQYHIFPKFYDQFDHLNSVLSLKDNEFLSRRWNQFLNMVPENYVKIRLHVDYRKEKEINAVRRKILNGHFYGVDNKLAPIPQLTDPRNIGRTMREYKL